MLIVRVGLFWIFDGAGEGSARHGSVRYSRVAAQDDPSLPWLYAWGARAVGASLARGDTVTLNEGSLLAEEGGRAVARWALSQPMVPRWWLPRSEAL